MTGKKRNSAPVAAFWALAARQSERLIGIVSIAILARALTPADFGLVAMSAIAVAIAELLSAFGFDWALIRIKDSGRSHYDTAWTLRLLSGVLIFIALLVLATPVASYFNKTEVRLIIQVMAFNILIGSFENIGTVDFRKYSRFDLEFAQRILSKIVGFLIAVSIALIYHSYWALVLGITASRLSAVVASYAMHPYRPKFSLKETPELLSFSFWMLAGNVADTIASKFVDAWIGKWLGPKEVGYYSLANEISSLATTEFAAPINRTVFAKYTKIAGNLEELKAAYLSVAGLIWYIGLPAASGIALCSNDIVGVLLGPQWADAGTVLQVLAMAGALKVMAANSHYVYWALGRAKFVTLLQLVSAALFVTLTLIIGSKWALGGVAVAQLIASAVVLAINFLVLSRTLSLRVLDIWNVAHRCVAATVLMALCVNLAKTQLVEIGGRYIAYRLAACVSIGVLTYVSILWSMWVVAGRPLPSVESRLVDLFLGFAKRGPNKAIVERASE